jgi:hypothetical protein
MKPASANHLLASVELKVFRTDASPFKVSFVLSKKQKRPCGIGALETLGKKFSQEREGVLRKHESQR